MSYKKDDLEETVSRDSSQNNYNDNNDRISGFWDSFKRQEIVEEFELDSNLNEEQKKNIRLANQPYRQTLDSRVINMIAIGGTLGGAGLFIGLGYSLTSGPGALLIGFTLVGIAIYCVVQCAAELAVTYPTSGSFAIHISRFIDPSIGFTIATNYALSWLISFPSELIGTSITIQYWNTSVNSCVWIAIFWLFIIILNIFTVRFYGESEFVMSIVKVIAISIFIIIGIVLICGGGPDNKSGYLGMKYWHNPGSFAQPKFKSVCNTFVSAAYSYGGTELVVITAAESKNVRSVSKASKQVFWRIAIFYITTVVVIGCLVPYTDPRLLGGDSDEDITASPFVIALSNAGTKFGNSVSSFMNAMILVASLSVCNSCVYASSRVIQSLGASGDLPSIFAYIDKRGIPLVGVIVSAIFGLLAFLVASSSSDEVFTWLFALCSISAFCTWFSICWAHLRFRRALKAQGRDTGELIYTSQLGVFGSYLGMLLNTLLIIGEIYISIWPLGEKPNAEAFFENCLSIPIMIVAWFGYKIYTRKKWTWRLVNPLNSIDLDSGRRETDIELLKFQIKEEKDLIASKPFYYRYYHFWC